MILQNLTIPTNTLLDEDKNLEQGDNCQNQMKPLFRSHQNPIRKYLQKHL